MAEAQAETEPAATPSPMVRKNRDWVDWLVIVIELIAAIAAFASAYAAFKAANAARDQVEISRSLPFESAQFDARWSAYRTYLEAASKFKNRQQDAWSQIPRSNGKLTVPTSWNADQIKKARQVGEVGMNAFYDYNAMTNGVAPLWPEDIRTKLTEANLAGEAMILCFRTLAKLSETGGKLESYIVPDLELFCISDSDNDGDGVSFDKKVITASAAMEADLNVTRAAYTPSQSK